MATIQERLEMATCYYGPTQDRLTIAEARMKGFLRFQVWLHQAFLKPAEHGLKGTHQELEPAIAQARTIPHAEVHAIALPFSFPEGLVWSESYERWLAMQP